MTELVQKGAFAFIGNLFANIFNRAEGSNNNKNEPNAAQSKAETFARGTNTNYNNYEYSEVVMPERSNTAVNSNSNNSNELPTSKSTMSEITSSFGSNNAVAEMARLYGILNLNKAKAQAHIQGQIKDAAATKAEGFLNNEPVVSEVVMPEIKSTFGSHGAIVDQARVMGILNVKARAENANAPVNNEAVAELARTAGILNLEHAKEEANVQGSVSAASTKAEGFINNEPVFSEVVMPEIKSTFGSHGAIADQARVMGILNVKAQAENANAPVNNEAVAELARTAGILNLERAKEEANVQGSISAASTKAEGFINNDPVISEISMPAMKSTFGEHGAVAELARIYGILGVNARAVPNTKTEETATAVTAVTATAEDINMGYADAIAAFARFNLGSNANKANKANEKTADNAQASTFDSLAAYALKYASMGPVSAPAIVELERQAAAGTLELEQNTQQASAKSTKTTKAQGATFDAIAAYALKYASMGPVSAPAIVELERQAAAGTLELEQNTQQASAKSTKTTKAQGATFDAIAAYALKYASMAPVSAPAAVGTFASLELDRKANETVAQTASQTSAKVASTRAAQFDALASYAHKFAGVTATATPVAMGAFVEQATAQNNTVEPEFHYTMTDFGAIADFARNVNNGIKGNTATAAKAKTEAEAVSAGEMFKAFALESSLELRDENTATNTASVAQEDAVSARDMVNAFALESSLELRGEDKAEAEEIKLNAPSEILTSRALVALSENESLSREELEDKYLGFFSWLDPVQGRIMADLAQALHESEQERPTTTMTVANEQIAAKWQQIVTQLSAPTLKHPVRLEAANDQERAA